MPKDNDSLINDILSDADNKKKLNENENDNDYESGSDDDARIDSFLEKSFRDSEVTLRSAETELVDENYGEEFAVDAEEDDIHKSEKPVNNKKKKKKRKKRRYRLPGVLILTTLIFAISVCLSLVIIAFGKDMLGIGKSEETQIIVIPEGATTEEISLMLQQDGIIKSPEFFQLFSRIRGTDGDYVSGEHFVRPNMAYETIIHELTTVQSEEKEEVAVMFQEGITLIEAGQKLEEAGVCSASDFLFYFNSGGYNFEFEKRLSSSTTLKFYRMEGYLFPDTYYFYKDMEPDQVCQKIYLNFDNKMTDERYAKMEELGLTLDQLITFSSIVQAEAPYKEAMIMVASVFWNRLNHPDVFPLLQSSPTGYYAEEVIEPNMEIRDELILNAYDTDKSAGLPPGAICNPGIDAIDAVLENFQSDYYYFYANVDTKQTYFAITNEEHEANIEMVKEQQANAENPDEY